MKCHYEVLGIERDADDKTIKNGTIELSNKFLSNEKFLYVNFIRVYFFLQHIVN